MRAVGELRENFNPHRGEFYDFVAAGGVIVNTAECAKRFETTETTIRRWMFELGIDLPYRRKREERYKGVVRWLESVEHVSVGELRKRTGSLHDSFTKRLRRERPDLMRKVCNEIQRRHERREAVVDDIIRNGLTADDVVAKYGYKRNTAANLVKDARLEGQTEDPDVEPWDEIYDREIKLMKYDGIRLEKPYWERYRKLWEERYF